MKASSASRHSTTTASWPSARRMRAPVRLSSRAWRSSSRLDAQPGTPYPQGHNDLERRLEIRQKSASKRLPSSTSTDCSAPSLATAVQSLTELRNELGLGTAIPAESGAGGA